MLFVHLLDLIGVFAFATYGAHKAIIAKFDLFGVFVCGSITAFGGGTIREIILNETPSYLLEYDYLAVAVLGAVFAIMINDYFRKMSKTLLIVDAIGVVAFAYLGALRAEEAGLGLAAMIFFAVLTAVGGGVITDVIVRRRPEAFYLDFYPLAAIALAIGYYVLRPTGEQVLISLALITWAFAIRVVSIRLNLRLWKPGNKLFSFSKLHGIHLQPIKETSTIKDAGAYPDE
jgi:uncharacterized membrane protein YeiH